MYFISLVLENLAFSIDDNEDILYCLKVNFDSLLSRNTKNFIVEFTLFCELIIKHVLI